MRSALSVLAVLGVVTVEQTATAGDSTLAETLFREGKALMKAGDLTAACPKLAESYRQDEATGTLLALAMCQEKKGELASAWTSFNAVIGRSEQEGRADRATAARARAAALEPRLSRLTVSVNPETASLQGLEVKRDNLVLPRAAWGTPTPVDAGEHVVEASAPGHERFHATRTISAESVEERVEIPTLAPAPSAPRTSLRSPTPRLEPAQPPRTPPATSNSINHKRAGGTRESDTSTTRVVSFVTGGLGIVSLGVGAGFAIRAAQLNAAAVKAGCDPKSHSCPPEILPQTKEIVQAGDLATGFVIAGSALAVGSVVLYLLSSDGTPSAQLDIGVLVGRPSAGIVVRGEL